MKRLTISANTCTETLALLIAVAWADGRLDDREKAGVRGAAKVLNLSKELRDKLDEMLEEPPKTDDLALDKLSSRDRAFAYVAAAWMAHADQELHEKEVALLGEVAAKMALAKERQDELMKIAESLEPLPDGTRSWSEEITRLFKAIPPELEEEIGEDFEVTFE